MYEQYYLSYISTLCALDEQDGDGVGELRGVNSNVYNGDENAEMSK